MYSISVALPGSIVLNARTPELQARFDGQIARTCAAFTVDDIVVFDEGSGAASYGRLGTSFDANSLLRR
ncbi:putative methyltransferase C9orf114 [Tilletia horrida]|nr:putative methyltransferase C9orf114 [Tilletia horrida]KAK0559247.1 putative methyltransferase C9orf114 [Tilletia horrida]